MISYSLAQLHLPTDKTDSYTLPPWLWIPIIYFTSMTRSTMNLENKIQNILVWIAAITCFIIGSYIALDHTINFFNLNNYLFAPIGDEATDAARTVYPILTGKMAFSEILHPFADHRVVLGRLQEMFDYKYTNGLQIIQPYRITLILWLTAILFTTFIIIKNETLSKPAKVLLTGIYLTTTFTAMNSNNYNSTMMITWPYIYLFGLLAFIFVEKYCTLIKADSTSKMAYLYIFLTYLFASAAVLTFNIGLIFWPIIYVLLFKQKCMKRHWYLWSLSLLTYVLYFHNWIPTQGVIGAQQFWRHPIDVFLYMSRILGVPFDSAALYHASLTTVVIASFIVIFSVIFLLKLLRKKSWSNADAIFFGYFLFSFIALCAISSMRFWMSGEAALIGLRFTTTTFNLIACILLSFFTVPITDETERSFVRASFSMMVMVWLAAFYFPNIHSLSVPYNQRDNNQFLISESIGIPIDQGFIDATKDLQNLQDLTLLTYLNDTQKMNKKGIYTFWPTEVINKPISDLHLSDVSCDIPTVLTPKTDFRSNHNPGMLVGVGLQQRKFLDESWFVLFTNDKNTIMGYALPTSIYRSLADRLTRTATNLQWGGAINTNLLGADNTVIAWAVDKKSNRMCQLGSIKV